MVGKRLVSILLKTVFVVQIISKENDIHIYHKNYVEPSRLTRCGLHLYAMVGKASLYVSVVCDR